MDYAHAVIIRSLLLLVYEWWLTQRLTWLKMRWRRPEPEFSKVDRLTLPDWTRENTSSSLILHDTHLAWLQWIDFKNSTESRILNEFSLLSWNMEFHSNTWWKVWKLIYSEANGEKVCESVIQFMIEYCNCPGSWNGCEGSHCEHQLWYVYVFGENSPKFSEDSGVVDQYIYSVTIAIGLSTRMKVKQFH